MVVDNGRIDIDLKSNLAKTLVKLVPSAKDPQTAEPSSRFSTLYQSRKAWNIGLNIVIQVVGSRGDVQPFIALGQELQKRGHRVRLATHNVFDSFVRESNLEFFPIGGDPKELMAYMVKNPGLIPSMKSLREGDIQRKRAMVSEILDGCWKSCIEADPLDDRPFVADTIIANPPSFAHIHCAQALGIPLHLMFTMPWSSTRAFPHPLANFKVGDLDPAIVNHVSYGIVEWMTWQGLGDVINKWRNGLDLEPIPTTVGPVLAETLEIPFTYCWSPALVPKPIDWASHIDVCGFFFRDPPPYTPPVDIDNFLHNGPPPVYIGFGSIVIDDPAKMTSMILEAVQICGVRAIISRGWSKLGGDSSSTKDVLFIDDCPHEWLFQHVSAVVHHGGAGTAACGLRNACPTTIVPFFGDQPFWGDMIAAAGAGPEPIPYKSVTTERLVDAISFCLTPSASEAARTISLKMATENGVDSAVHSFHANLPLETLPCELLPHRPAVWVHKKTSVRLSSLAAQVLVDNFVVNQSDLRLYATHPLAITHTRWDPITSTSSAGLSTVHGMTKSATGLLIDPYDQIKNSKEDSSALSTAGKIAGGTAKNFGKFNMHFFKGAIVDLPYAAAEGFRAVPRLYGEEVQDHGQVKDWKSGFGVAGKSFTHGVAGGASDLFVKPFQEAKKEGALGFVKGIGKGTLGFTSKTASAVLGLVAYPGQGLCKSIRTLAKSETRRMIASKRSGEGRFLAATAGAKEVKRVLDGFEGLNRERM
ncbi:putative sterol glucosyltransferase [Corynespora cassiicola Philippines]|uniref:Putative sterol glucosyltransferase n=1 Tax=Corynespora cassiicola Philippines TaxID=1448308 RepID=A0A2T2P9K6_CORCC|nr:putative sterol glucosyltransferase [Corynespora cassiicola Philippines]